MTLRSDAARRRRLGNHGFSLLETLVTFALVAVVLAAIIPILPGQSTRTAQRLHRLLATEFAYSILEEYRVTYPQMLAKGRSGQWHWQVAEASFKPAEPGALDGLVQYIELTATVWVDDERDSAISLTTMAARPAP